MANNILRLWLLIIFTVLYLGAFAQSSNLTYDKKLECDELISDDTIQYNTITNMMMELRFTSPFL